jgi:hypothetical protein
VIGGVEAVASERCQVDPPDERELAVDDHELLVMAVHWALVGVERALHPSATDQLLAYSANRRPCGREDGHWRAAPQQHPHLHALGQLAEQVAQPGRPLVARQAEIRGDVPARYVHVRARLPERLGYAGQRLGAVDQHLQRAALARRRSPGRPERSVGRGLELIEMSDAAQPAPVVRADRGLDPLTCPPIHALNQASHHPQSLPAARFTSTWATRRIA